KNRDGATCRRQRGSRLLPRPAPEREQREHQGQPGAVEEARARFPPEGSREREAVRLPMRRRQSLRELRRAPADPERCRRCSDADQQRPCREPQRCALGAAQRQVGTERGGEGEEQRGRRDQLLGEPEDASERDEREEDPIDAEGGPGRCERKQYRAREEKSALSPRERAGSGEQECGRAEHDRVGEGGIALREVLGVRRGGGKLRPGRLRSVVERARDEEARQAQRVIREYGTFL